MDDRQSRLLYSRNRSLALRAGCSPCPSGWSLTARAASLLPETGTKTRAPSWAVEPWLAGRIRGWQAAFESPPLRLTHQAGHRAGWGPRRVRARLPPARAPHPCARSLYRPWASH